MLINLEEESCKLENYTIGLKERGKKILTAFLMGGDPDPRGFLELAQGVIDGGADILEIGVPFTDPLADGPIIQNAAGRALQAGIDTDRVFSLVTELRQKNDIPLLLLTYFNPILRYGPGVFVEKARESGVDGLIIPDLPKEERKGFEDLEKADLPVIDFITPTMNRERAREILPRARGFLYCVSRTGVTGMRQDISPRLEKTARLAREYTSIPLLVGFGISSPEQARKAACSTDGVIIGSALVEEIDKNPKQPDKTAAVLRDKISQFKKGLEEETSVK